MAQWTVRNFVFVPCVTVKVQKWAFAIHKHHIWEAAIGYNRGVHRGPLYPVTFFLPLLFKISSMS